MINDKEYKKLEVRILKNLLYRFGYKINQYTIKKTKHVNVPTKLYIVDNDPFIFNEVYKRINEQITLKNMQVYFDKITERDVKRPRNSILRRRVLNKHLDKHLVFKLDRNIDIEVYKGLLKLQGIL